MTTVFFYHGASDRLAAACALLSGASAQKKAVRVFAPDEAVAANLDRLLWTHPALGFVPHCRAASPVADETPILIDTCLDGEVREARLMNLGADVPPGFARFESIIEVVGQDDASRDAGRERVRFYKAQGCDVRFVDLSDR